MGQQAREKQLRRQIRALDKQRMAALYEEKSQQPEIVARQEADAADEELQKRWQADLPWQRVRLQGAGWRHVVDSYFGAGGWVHQRSRMKLIHSISREPDGNIWSHMSLSLPNDQLPGWPALRDTHRLLYPDLVGVQVVAPEDNHVNLAEVAHIWTCLTSSVIPDFGQYGTI